MFFPDCESRWGDPEADPRPDDECLQREQQNQFSTSQWGQQTAEAFEGPNRAAQENRHNISITQFQ